jgi:hypothetical protein
MGLLSSCCGKDGIKTPSPIIPTPPRVVPKLVRRISARTSRPRVSKQNVEMFYREGRELSRAEEEERERARLRAAMREMNSRDEFEREPSYDEDAREFPGPANLEDLALGKAWPGLRGSIRRWAAPYFIQYLFTDLCRRDSFDMRNSPDFQLANDSRQSTALVTHANSYAILGTTEPRQFTSKATAAFDEPGPNSYPYRLPSTTLDNLFGPTRGTLAGDIAAASQYDLVKVDTETASDRSEVDLTPTARLSHSAALARELPKIDTKMKGAAKKNALVFPSEEIFSQIPNLLRPSTSTFFGSSHSQIGRRNLNSPASDDMELKTRFSQPAGQISRKQSKSTLFIQQRIDSASSFYPSGNESQYQLPQESTVDVPNTGYTGQPSTMPSRYPRKKSIDRLARAHSIGSRSRTSFKGVDSPGFSKFSFPWNGGEASPARTVIRAGSIAETVPDGAETPKKAIQKMEPPRKQSIITKTNEPHVKPQKRSSSSRAITGMFNFVKSGITGSDYASSTASVSSLHTPATFDTRRTPAETTATTVTPAEYSGRYSHSVTSKRSGRTIQPRESWYSRATSSAGDYSERTSGDLRRSSSFRERSSGLRQVAIEHSPERNSTALRRSSSLRERPSGLHQVAMETEESLGRFDHLGEPDGPRRPRSLLLRKSFTHSMAKIREKVSISGFKKTGAIEAEADKPAPAKKPDANPKIQFDSGTPPPQKTLTIPSRGVDSAGTSIYSRGRHDAGSLRRSNTVYTTKTALTMPSRRPTKKSVYRLARDTAYDECVTLPFADGGDDTAEEEDRRLGDVYKDFQEQEYASEYNFWTRSRSMADITRDVNRRVSAPIGTAQ